MCLSSLAKELGADCTPVKFTLPTVSGTQRKEGQQLYLDVVGVATGKKVRLVRAGKIRQPHAVPHHPVIHPQKPEKVRIVFDCAGRFQNTSLNDRLLQGPDFANSLVEVLLKFREERIALMADIKKIFHHVRVETKDSEALRFLWWPEGGIDQDPCS